MAARIYVFKFFTISLEAAKRGFRPLIFPPLKAHLLIGAESTNGHCRNQSIGANSKNIHDRNKSIGYDSANTYCKSQQIGYDKCTQQEPTV